MIKDSGERRTFSTGSVRDIQEEQWVGVIGFENEYEVSNKGRVRSLYLKTRVADKGGRILKQKTDSHGYLRVNLYKNGAFNKAALVSRLVATAFIPNPQDLPQVGHWDDDKKNNDVTNLYWTDAKENNSHNGKMERFQKSHRDNIHDIARKLSIQVVGISEETGEKLLFSSMHEAEKYGFDSCKISMCINGKRKTHKKFKWEKAK